MAVSLVVAPAPGLLLFMYVNGGVWPAPAEGIAVYLVSAIGYWIWLNDRRTRSDLEARAERVRATTPERPVDAPAAAGEPDHLTAQRALRASRLRAQEALRSHDDLPDALAMARAQSATEVLLDRVADQRQLKALVSEHEVTLLNAFHRSVRRDQYGAPDYQHWSHEADRFLMSSNFMARTMSRHEAIATVTAEVEFRMAERARATERQLPPPPREAARPVQPALTAPPAFDLSPEVRRPVASAPTGREPPLILPAPISVPARPLPAMPAPAEASGIAPGVRISDGLRQRLAALRASSFTEDCAEILARHGWVTQATAAPGSDQIDLFAERGDLIAGLRCRPGGEPIGEGPLEEVTAARDRFGLDAVGIVATAGFTSGARSRAALDGVCLLDRDDLADLHLYLVQRKKVVPLFKGQAQG